MNTEGHIYIGGKKIQTEKEYFKDLYLKQNNIIEDLRQMILHLQSKVEQLDGMVSKLCHVTMTQSEKFDELEKSLSESGGDDEEEDQEDMNKEVAMHFIGVIRNELCKLAQYIEG